MDRREREALDRHLTGNWGEDSVSDDGDVTDYRPWTALDGNHDPAPRTYHSDRLGAVTIPEDEPDYGGVFDGFGVVSDADPGL